MAEARNEARNEVRNEVRNEATPENYDRWEKTCVKFDEAVKDDEC